MVVLALLDLSAAFDTIEHSILISRLETRFGVTGLALQWITSYLSDRTQQVVINGAISESAALLQGVPQGSVLGPILFTIYVSPLADIAKRFGMQYHFYADDSQLYVSFEPKTNIVNILSRLEECILAFRNCDC